MIGRSNETLWIKHAGQISDHSEIYSKLYKKGRTLRNDLGHCGSLISHNRKSIAGKFEVALRKNAISQAINKLEKFILLYQGQFSWEECLSLYRGKDVVEKGFDILKNDIDLMPAHVRTDNTSKRLSLHSVSGSNLENEANETDG